MWAACVVINANSRTAASPARKAFLEMRSFLRTLLDVFWLGPSQVRVGTRACTACTNWGRIINLYRGMIKEAFLDCIFRGITQFGLSANNARFVDGLKEPRTITSGPVVSRVL